MSESQPSLSLLLHSRHWFVPATVLAVLCYCCISVINGGRGHTVDSMYHTSLCSCICQCVCNQHATVHAPANRLVSCTCLKSAAALQTSKNLFILVPSLLGALLTLIALAVCGLFPRYILPLCQTVFVDTDLTLVQCRKLIRVPLFGCMTFTYPRTCSCVRNTATRVQVVFLIDPMLIGVCRPLHAYMMACMQTADSLSQSLHQCSPALIGPSYAPLVPYSGYSATAGHMNLRPPHNGSSSNSEISSGLLSCLFDSARIGGTAYCNALLAVAGLHSHNVHSGAAAVQWDIGPCRSLI